MCLQMTGNVIFAKEMVLAVMEGLYKKAEKYLEFSATQWLYELKFQQHFSAVPR